MTSGNALEPLDEAHELVSVFGKPFGFGYGKIRLGVLLGVLLGV